MKNTLIPLDMIFVSAEGKIVHIEKNVQPCNSYCKSYSSQKPAQYVVEINAGLSDKFGIEEGQRIVINI